MDDQNMEQAVQAVTVIELTRDEAEAKYIELRMQERMERLHAKVREMADDELAEAVNRLHVLLTVDRENSDADRAGEVVERHVILGAVAPESVEPVVPIPPEQPTTDADVSAEDLAAATSPSRPDSD